MLLISSIPLVTKLASSFKAITLENGGWYDMATYYKGIAGDWAGDAIKDYSVLFAEIVISSSVDGCCLCIEVLTVDGNRR